MSISENNETNFRPLIDLFEKIENNPKYTITQDPLFHFKPLTIKKKEFTEILNTYNCEIDKKFKLPIEFILTLNFSLLSSARCLIFDIRNTKSSIDKESGFLFIKGEIKKLLKIKANLKKDYNDTLKKYEQQKDKFDDAIKTFIILLQKNKKITTKKNYYFFKTNNSGNFSIGTHKGKSFLIQAAIKNKEVKLTIDKNNSILLHYTDENNEEITKKYIISNTLKHHWLKRI